MKIRSLSFSPDGQFFVVGSEMKMQVWRTPGLHKEFSPFILHREYSGHFDSVVALDWSQDSK